MLSTGASGPETSKTLMQQMINLMTTKMELGSPMASLYVLGNPDHYKSHEYVNFSWRPYTIFVKCFWEDLSGNIVPEDLDDFVTLQKQNGSFVAYSSVDDYRYRPLVYESLKLYEWIQSSIKKAHTPAQLCKFEKLEKLLQKLAADNDCEQTSEDNSDFDPDDGDSTFIVKDLPSEEDHSDDEDTDDDISDWNTEDEDAEIVEKMEKKKQEIRENSA